VAVSFQDGALIRTGAISWAELNLLYSSDMTIREADSLLLTACPAGATNGTVTIAISDESNLVTNIVTSYDAPVAYKFSTAGNYLVQGSHDNGTVTSNSINVSVISASFPQESPACLLGTVRTWATCTNVPTTVFLDSDSTVDAFHNGSNYCVRTWKVNRDHYVVARLYPGGPILDSCKLSPFWIQAAVDAYMWIIETYEDSRLWENIVVTKNVPAGVDIQFKIITSGVTFEDLSIEKWIESDDLDEIGEYSLKLIKPDSQGGSACHSIKMYQNGEYLGEAYYSGVLMPDE